MNALASAVDWLTRQRDASLAESVVYRRGAESVELRATIGATNFEQVDDLGVVTRVRSKDFIVRTGDALLGGQPFEPRRGDRIEQAIGDGVRVFEVMSAFGNPPWRWTDGHETSMRIHTKQVS